MPSLINFTVNVSESLTMVEDAIVYANTVTRNLLYDTGLNSPFRILLEAQIYIYERFLIILKNAERELRLIFFELIGFTPQTAINARVNLKFELVEPRANENTYFKQGFPVKAENGIIFLTDRILVIPPGSRVGYVAATSSKPGIDGNLGPFRINQALQVIDVAFTVTNESASTGGRNGETIEDLANRAGQFIRRNGLISQKDWYDFVKEYNPRIVSSIIAEEPYKIEVYACLNDGSALTPAQLGGLDTELQNRKPLGVESIIVAPITVIRASIIVIGSITAVSIAEGVANDINKRLRTFVRPDNLRQVEGNSRGIILNDDLKRIVHQTRIDYIQTISIGEDAITAYGQNFEFDPIVERVTVSTITVTLIKDDYNGTFTFN